MQKVQIDISIFYNNLHFHLLISECLKPFLREVQSEKISPAYFIFVGKHQGNHLKICLQVAQADVSKLELITNQTVKKFLEEKPSPSTALEFPLKAPFMDFPNNSIQYNLAVHSFSPFQEPVTDGLRHFISTALLNFSGDEVLDKDSFFIFSIYLQLFFIKQAVEAKDMGKVITDYYNMLIGSVDTEKRNVLTNFTDNLLEENREEFSGIITEVWDEQNLKSPEWLHQCKLPAMTKIEKFSDFQSQFSLFNKLIFQHCNIGDSTQLLVSVMLLYNLLNSIKTNYKPQLI